MPAVDEVEAELTRTVLFRLPFRESLEERYRADARSARIRSIRLTAPIGLVAYVAVGLADGAILPDLGSLPMVLRLGLIAPLGLVAMVLISRWSDEFREAFAALSMACAMLIAVLSIAISQAPNAPYTMLVVVLVSVFANITMRLRFDWACAFSAVTATSVGAVLWIRTDMPQGVPVIILVATLTSVIFGLVANYQLERTERRSYLLSLREMLRAERLVAANAEISALSLVDPLTGVANRRAFDARLADLWTVRETQGRQFALLMIDVDHFKRFNDHYGHPAGDACLRSVAAALRDGIVRQGDLVARYGGEEFAALLADCSLADALQIGQRLCRSMCDVAMPHANRGDGGKVVTASIGVASTEDAEALADVVMAADRGLYAAKRAGRNRVFADAPDTLAA